MGKCNFKKPFELHSFNDLFLLWHDQTHEHEFECFYTMSINKNHFKKQKYVTKFV